MIVDLEESLFTVSLVDIEDVYLRRRGIEDVANFGIEGINWLSIHHGICNSQGM